MKAVCQRVKHAHVDVVEQGTVTHSENIGAGLVVYLGIQKGDTDKDLQYMVDKVLNMRIFEQDGKSDLSLLSTKGDLLLVSQFTLLADTRSGRRPSFTQAEEPEKAKAMVEACLAAFKALAPAKVASGVFRSHMQVHAVVDGPYTILLDSTSTLDSRA